VHNQDIWQGIARTLVPLAVTATHLSMSLKIVCIVSQTSGKTRRKQQVQIISPEPHGEDPRVTVITRGGVVTGEDRVTLRKTTEESGVRKAAEKTQVFDAKKEK
jgi:hypothetical protein